MNGVLWGLLLAPVVTGQTRRKSEVLPSKPCAFSPSDVWGETLSSPAGLLYQLGLQSTWQVGVNPARLRWCRHSFTDVPNKFDLSGMIFSSRFPVHFFSPCLSCGKVFMNMFPLGQSVTNRMEMSSKQTCCSLVAANEAPVSKPYCFLFLVLRGLYWISSRSSVSGCRSRLGKGYQK